MARRDPAQGQFGPLRNGQTGRDAHAEAVAALRFDRVSFSYGELPVLDGVQEVVISDEVVNGNARPLYIYSDRRSEAAPGA